MEKNLPGAGQISIRWIRKHNFTGKLDTKDVLRLQVDLKAEIS